MKKLYSLFFILLWFAHPLKISWATPSLNDEELLLNRQTQPKS